MRLKAGDWVQVRSKEEILRTLDQNGRLGELPFMPQMFTHCGQIFQVYRRAHKTCDTVNRTGGRRLVECVHLELRCDGKAYGGCQAGCLIFWKEAWLKYLGKDGNTSRPAAPDESLSSENGSGSQIACREQDVRNATRVKGHESGDAVRYACQATQLPYFTTPLRWWDSRQYVEDYTSGNVTVNRVLCGFAYLTYYHLAQAWRNKIGRPSRWLYDRFQGLRGGIPFPRKRGTFPDSQQAPSCNLNLQPGELVQVKSHQEILATVHSGGMNRGLLFDTELVPYCGGVHRVKARVGKFIDESSGRMISLKTPAVVLDNVWCQARYSNCRMFCPRSIYSWWREIWLERASAGPVTHESAKVDAAK